MLVGSKLLKLVVAIAAVSTRASEKKQLHSLGIGERYDWLCSWVTIALVSYRLGRLGRYMYRLQWCHHPMVL